MEPVKLFIVTINKHPVWGPLLVPYFAHEVSPGLIHIDENANVHEESDFQDKIVRKIIIIARSYTERRLMKVYSKEKMIADFLRKLNEETLNQLIRPYIEKKHCEMIALIQKNSIPLYLRDVGVEWLYDHHRIDVSPTMIDVRFHCEATDRYFRYALHCFQDNRQILLQKMKPCLILSSDPAVIVLGHELLVFENIRSGRIMPFLEKSYVEVPATETRRYMKMIVLPLLSDYPVEASGFEIREQIPSKTAEVCISQSLSEIPNLVLSFRYGKNIFTPESEVKRFYSVMEEQDGRFLFTCFRRDRDWEQFCIAYLKKAGFKQISDSHFQNNRFTSVFELVDWLREQRTEMTKLFVLKNAQGEEPYYIGNIDLSQEVNDEPDWFDLHITVRMENYVFSFIRFKKNILSGERRFLLPDGRIALLPEVWFDKYSDLFRFGEDRDEGIRIRKIHVGLLQELDTGAYGVSKAEYSEKETVPVPLGIRATLRPYQQAGFSWLVHLMKNRLGGCLADDMGLGKTVQTIALLQHLYDPPAPEKHTRKKLPVIDTEGQLSLFGGTDFGEKALVDERSLPREQRSSLIVVPTSLLPNWRREICKFSFLRVYEYAGEKRTKNVVRAFSRFQIVLVTYGLLRRDIDLLDKYAFKYVILDESQYIKNPESQTYQCVVRLQSEYRLALTGTPIENSLKDLWAQLNFLNPGLLGSWSFFRNQYVLPITKDGNTRMKEKLMCLISPFILRRTKRQVAPELPPLTEEVITCEMIPAQLDIYQKEKNRIRNSFLDEWKKNKLLALNGISRLRQLANHPKLVFPEFEGTSGKMEQIVDAYETLLSEGHKVLIFSSYVTHLDLLAGEFRKRNWQYALLTGSTLDREKEIARFMQEPDVSAFLISLKAGGVGLNLTEADYVFIIDPWWNPATEMQAESRAHRIGQDKQVFVYRFISANTIEEKIRALQERKSHLAETFVSENDPLQTLTDEEWRGLLRE
ncbi:MAG: DEAD/DEAH box helicase [Massilibacteroides sp.]|nr:DEAD/DEAH box helicase [Massilibacteroides sp.]MDD3061990.1 DEAD/DEAH box helicase [Massilibacteroides sp.]MDD4114045.1 DEAD/DEAH box helicase [Massilibacteroides sp.]MDD4659293.1 DEAD/DEAH box helicase [Massilibacteroides sp.]